MVEIVRGLNLTSSGEELTTSKNSDLRFIGGLWKKEYIAE